MSDSSPSSAPSRPSWMQPERLAAAVFAVGLVVAFVAYTIVGRRNWFFLDEWDFLATRSLGSPDDLLRPHNEHWSTLPIIVYRVLWRVFGVRTYLPYVTLVIGLHLTAALLLRVIMRRAGVHPWLATAGAGMFLFLGTGFQNIVWAFQIGFVGSLVCGLAHLILSDHEGGFDRRDALGLGLGLAGLMCSGVSVTLVGVVGLSVLIRRGWRLALVHTVPLAVVFGAWWLAFGRDSYENSLRPSVSEVVDFVTTGISNALGSMAAVAVVAVLLVAVLVVGGVLRVVDHRREATPLPAVPWALLAGALVFMTVIGLGRSGALGSEAAKPSRYVHLLGAMTLPAIAVGAQAIARRWRMALPVLAVLLVFGVPGNMAEIAETNTLNERLLGGNPQLVETLPTVDLAREVPGGTHPDRNILIDVTIRWLRQGNRSGRIPDPDRPGRRIIAIARTRLALEQVRDESAPKGCAALRSSERIELDKGERVRFVGGDVNVRLEENGEQGPDVQYIRPRNSALVARIDDLVVWIGPSTRNPVLLCQ